LFLHVPAPAWAQPRHQLRGHLPTGMATLKAVDRLPGWTNLSLAIGLPLRNPEALTNFLQQLYDPASPLFHQYLTPEQFTERFGPTEKEYQKVVDFARSKGFTVATTHPNRLLLDVKGTVADIEAAFAVTLRVYPHPGEPRNFHAPDVEPSVPEGLPILDISGLEDYMPPRPMNLKRPSAHQDIAYATGSGSGGSFIGADFRAAYAPGVTLTGWAR
jgi:subtilase family serine protease